MIDRFYNLIAIQCSSTASSKISLEKQMIKKFSSCYGSFATVLAIPLVPTGASLTHSMVLPFVVTLLPHICHILCPSHPPSFCSSEQHSANYKSRSCHFPLHSDIHIGTSLLKCTQLVSFPSSSSQSFTLI